MASVSHISSWWRHQMETFAALLAICVGNSPVTGEFPHKGQWRGALMFSLICAWINSWVNNREAGDFGRHRAHYDVIAMWCTFSISKQKSLPPFVFFMFLEAIRHIRHFFDWQSFQGNTLYPLAIIHMEHINVLDFDDKSERNLCFWTFFFGNSGIIFKVASAQLFPLREKW